MSWNAYFHPKFKAEFDKLPEAVQDELFAKLIPLRKQGPLLGRPHVDTLKGSEFANMKELRFRADGGGVWPSRSIRSGMRSCWWLAISRVAVRLHSIDD